MTKHPNLCSNGVRVWKMNLGENWKRKWK